MICWSRVCFYKTADPPLSSLSPFSSPTNFKFLLYCSRMVVISLACGPMLNLIEILSNLCAESVLNLKISRHLLLVRLSWFVNGDVKDPLWSFVVVDAKPFAVWHVSHVANYNSSRLVWWLGQQWWLHKQPCSVQNGRFNQGSIPMIKCSRKKITSSEDHRR